MQALSGLPQVDEAYHKPRSGTAQLKSVWCKRVPEPLLISPLALTAI